MDIYNTSIHVVIGKYTVRHICHVFDLTESVQCDLAVDAFVAFRCAVLMPGRLDETGAMALTVMPFGSNSFTSDLVRKWMAALVTPYTREEEYACCPA